MRQISLGIQNFASGNDGRLPGLASVLTSYSVPGAYSNVGWVGWPVSILPAIDNGALFRSIRKDTDTVGYLSRALQPVLTEQVVIPVFTCPDDATAKGINGGLSYVANVGMMSSALWTTTTNCLNDTEPNPSTSVSLLTLPALLAGSPFHYPGLIIWDSTTLEAVQIGIASGVFQRQLPGLTDAASLEYIAGGDGTTQTIAISENIQAGKWWDTSANKIGFGVRVEVNVGTSVPVAPFNRPHPVELNTLTTAFDSATGSDPSFINSNFSRFDSDLSNMPRPSSNHTGGVSAIFCDGHGSFLNENIDKAVYVKLITSNGVTYGEKTLNQGSY